LKLFSRGVPISPVAAQFHDLRLLIHSGPCDFSRPSGLSTPSSCRAIAQTTKVGFDSPNVLCKVIAIFHLSRKRAQGMKKVLLVERDPALLKRLAALFVDEGFDVTQTDSGIEAVALSITWQPDLLIVDYNITDAECLSIVRTLRKYSSMRIIVISPCDRNVNNVAILEAGANDFVFQPVNVEEMMARTRLVMGRNTNAIPLAEENQFGSFRLDHATRSLVINNRAVRFSIMEFAALRRLASSNGCIVTQQELIDMLWAEKKGKGNVKVLRVLIGRIRKKIEEEALCPGALVTKHGIGYQLTMNEPGDNY
jgi:DNA-binding response OmpR family regulator